jgi:parallel beta-helix repeat protein
MAVKRFLLLALVFSVMVTTAPVSADGEFYVIAGGGGVGTKITSLPYIISTPGFYYLTGNLNYSNNTGRAITISSDNVTLDLMGFAITGLNRGATRGILGENSGGLKNVEIRNGTVQGFEFGITDATSSSTSFRVFNARVRENSYGITLPGSGNLIKGCTVSNNTDGIYVNMSTASGNVVENCGRGIFGTGTISGNLVKNCATGIEIHGAGGSVIGNTVFCDTGQTGISLSTSAPIIMDQNTVSGTGTHYSGGGSNTVWAGKSATYPYGNNAGAPIPGP